jgi:hypothetical protein
LSWRKTNDFSAKAAYVVVRANDGHIFDPTAGGTER